MMIWYDIHKLLDGCSINIQIWVVEKHFYYIMPFIQANNDPSTD